MRRCVVFVVLALLGPPAQAAGSRCDAPRPSGPVGLPDSIFVMGKCGTFALRPDGIVEAVHPREWAPPWAERAQARADDGTYILHRHRHLVLVRDAETFWRSRLAHGSDEVVVHGDVIAFTAYEDYHPNLWVARVGEAEHLAGRGENLGGWARAGGFFTQRGIELRLRGADGRLVRRLGFVRAAAYDQETQTLVAITTADLLVRTDGRRTTTLADLVGLGLASSPFMELLPNRLIAVRSDNRLVLLRPDGTRFASAVLARQTRARPGATIASGYVPLPKNRGVAFVVNLRRTWTGRGTDRVLLLMLGHRVPRILYERRGTPLECAYWVGLARVGDRLLYAPTKGRALVVLDLRGGHGPLDLSDVVRRIPGFGNDGTIRRAAWATRWND